MEITEVRPNVPASFRPIIAHSLEKEPENRFQSARDLAFALSTLSNVTGTRTAGHRTFGSRSRKRFWWGLAAVLLTTAVGIALGFKIHAPVNPSYRRLTFERGTIYSARFASDARSVLYGASWSGQSLKLYTTSSDSPLEHALDLSGAHLLAVSPSNELAVELHGKHGSRREFVDGTLARAPLAERKRPA